jgi:short subunit dehydrogenase-like uncharacterized protein
MAESLSWGTPVRRRGRIVELRRTPVREMDFGDGPHEVIAVGWGDVVTAFYSTGVQNIECYFEGLTGLPRLVALNRSWGWFLRRRPFRCALKTLAGFGREGPTARQRASTHVVLIAEAEDKGGTRAQARLDTPESYTLTAMTAVEMARRALQGDARAGFQTPSRAFGADFILGFPGVSRRDL